MIINSFELDDLDCKDDEDFDLSTFDLEIVKSKINNYSSKKLCEIIVCDRYFKCYNDLAVVCMNELVLRRVNGDNFNYEQIINNSLDELPEVKFEIPDFSELLRTFMNNTK